MANLNPALACLIAVLIFCAIAHAVACVMVLHGNNIIMATLFGFQSLGCMALTVYAGVHTLRNAKPGKSSTSAWMLQDGDWVGSEADTAARYVESHGIDVDATDEGLTARWCTPPTNSWGPASLQRSRCWIWLFVVIIGGVDVLWALCGVRSLWFVATLGHIPGGTQGPTAALAVGVIVCTVLLSMGPAVNTATWLDRHVLVEVCCALVPSFLPLAQLALAGAPPQPSRQHSSPRRSFPGTPLGAAPQPPRCPTRNSTLHDLSILSLKDRRIRQSPHKPLRYSVSKLIASGGFSDVFLGLSHDTGELICVKQLKAGFVESDIAAMETEVSVLKRLTHPNIVQYLGTDRGDRFTILLGYVPGGSIALLLSQFGALEQDLVTLYVRQAVYGLQYLHSEGIVHGDIKGGNILVSDKGEVRLTDFGCSYCSRSADGNCLVMGTVLWMAPEVCRQESSNYSCDIWSLGCTILQMATNQDPWSEMQFEHSIPAFYHIATCQQPPQVPDTLCSPMQDVVRQCLQLEAFHRPTCDDLLATPWLAIDVNGTPDQDCLPTSYSIGSPRWSRLQLAATPKIVEGNAASSQGDSHGDLQKSVPRHLPLPGMLPPSRSVSPPSTTSFSRDLSYLIQPASARPRAGAVDFGTTSYAVPNIAVAVPDTHQSQTEDPGGALLPTSRPRRSLRQLLVGQPLAIGCATPTSPHVMPESLSGISSSVPLPEGLVRQLTHVTEESVATSQSCGSWIAKYAEQLEFLQATAKDCEEPLQAALQAIQRSRSSICSGTATHSSGIPMHRSRSSALHHLSGEASRNSSERRSGDRDSPLLRHNPALSFSASMPVNGVEQREAGSPLLRRNPALSLSASMPLNGVE